MVRGVRPFLEQRRVVALRQCPTTCKPIVIKPGFASLSRRVMGQTITSVRRVAKRVVMVFQDASVLAIEPRMTGLMLLADPPDPEHLRLEWCLEDDSGARHSVWFWDRRGLGTVSHCSAEEFDRLLNSGRIGVDALIAELADWERLSRTERPIKVAMLDQRKIAGIGNLYASEILHLARIHPERASSTLSGAQLQAIRAATQQVLNEAIAYEGSTLSDGTYRNALNRSGGYQNAHRVYDRADELCLSCGKGQVVRIVQAQRSSFFCPVCQKPGRRRPTK